MQGHTISSGRWVHRASVAVVCCCAGHAGAACVAYYPFDEGTSTVVHDQSGFGHNGTLVNLRGDSWATGKRGGAFYVPHITGTGGTRIELPADSHLAPVSAISFSAWVNTVSAYEDQPVIAKEGPDRLQYWFGLTRNQYGCLLDRNGTGAWDGDDRNQPFASSLNGTWQHIVSTWDGSTIRHYRNGVLDRQHQGVLRLALHRNCEADDRPELPLQHGSLLRVHR